MRFRRFATASICLSFLAACGGGTATRRRLRTPEIRIRRTTGTGSAKMTATIDGKAWTSATTLRFRAMRWPIDISSRASRLERDGTSIVLAIGDLPGPGTYPSAPME